MKERNKDNDSLELEKQSIREGKPSSVLSDAHEHRKEEKHTLTPEILQRLGAIVRVIIERIRSPTH